MHCTYFWKWVYLHLQLSSDTSLFFFLLDISVSKLSRFYLTNLGIQGKQRMSSYGDLMEEDQEWGSPPNPSLRSPPLLSTTVLSNQWGILDWKKGYGTERMTRQELLYDKKVTILCYVNHGIILVPEWKCNWFSRRENVLILILRSVIVLLSMTNMCRISLRIWENGDSDRVFDLAKVAQASMSFSWRQYLLIPLPVPFSHVAWMPGVSLTICQLFPPLGIIYHITLHLLFCGIFVFMSFWLIFLCLCLFHYRLSLLRTIIYPVHHCFCI